MLPVKQDVFPVPFLKRNSFFGVMGLVASMLAAFILPRTTAFEYRYTVGRTWCYEDLTAPFDFLLTDVAPTNDNIVTTPYYLMDQNIVREKKVMLGNLIQNQVKLSKQDSEYEDMIANVGAYRALGMQMLDAIYRKGIIEKKPKNSNAIAFVSHTNTQVPVNSFLSMSEAVDMATDSLPFSALRQPELLLPMIEKTLAPNVFFSDSLTALLGNGSKPSLGLIPKGTLIIKKGERIDESVMLQLDSLSRSYQSGDGWKVILGYFLFCCIAFMSLLGWLFLYQPEILIGWKTLAQLLTVIIGILTLITGCHYFGNAVPLLLPIYLIPLIMRPKFSLKSSIVIWSIPVILTGFALTWGMLWVSIQVAGAGVGLLLNDRVASWKDRTIALVVIFSVQTLVWFASLLADKVPVTMQTTDSVVFLAIAALLSISRSVLVRFINFRSE
jgi:cyclic-di-AMP phosphodiesterase PgpH